MTEAEAWELAAQAIREQRDASLAVMKDGRVDRRLFAAVHAMHAAITVPWHPEMGCSPYPGRPEDIARGAVEMADLLLAELDRPRATPTETPKEAPDA